MPKASKRSKSSTKDRSKKDKSEKSEKTKPSKKEEEIIEVEEEVVEEEVVETPVVTTKVKKDKKTAVTSDAVSTETVDESKTTEVEVDGKRQRRVVTKESVLDDFDQLLKEVEAEIEALRNPDAKKTKSKGVKFIRMVGKRVKGIRNDAGRVMRTRKASTRPKNTSSGFMKPVQISQEMAKFTGWEPDVPRSRVDVTKYLCQYIREKDLQNPADRRIIRPDSELKSLLKLQDESKDPLTYYSLQKSIQHHFTSENKAAAATAVVS
jgi:upstream activation factor subunit UAF30